MADALVERRPPARFFCHRCNIEFEHVLQDYTCPYCASGFIEQLESEAEGEAASGDDFSDDMSNLDDDDDMHQNTPPMLNDLAFLMSAGRLRGAGRRESLMEQFLWLIGGARGGATVQAGAPFVLVGAPGDYVFGGEGLDAVVTQLLGQLENAGPPPLPRDQIAAIPSEPVTVEHITNSSSCSVCWESFQIGETISRLECDHIFHSACIAPWLQLHATCPICRRSLLPEAAPPPAADAPEAPARAPATAAPSDAASDSSASSMTSLPRVVVRRIGLGRLGVGGTEVTVSADVTLGADAGESTSGSSMSVSRSNSASTTSVSSDSRSERSERSERTERTERTERRPDIHDFNMDIDFD